MKKILTFEYVGGIMFLYLKQRRKTKQSLE